jgi:PAS domain S-box-containing protein
MKRITENWCRKKRFIKRADSEVAVKHGESKVNVLMVDDHIESLIALEAVLEGSNYNLVKATSGEEALRQVLKTDFAVILLDIQMPEMNGIDIAKMIRKREKTQNIPIIFITGFGREQEQIAEGYATGAVDYLLKPVDPDILKAKVGFFTNSYIKNQSLLSAGENYKQLVERVPAIVWRCNSESMDVTFVSREAEFLLGYPLDQWLQPGFFKERVHPDDWPRLFKAWQKASGPAKSAEAEYRMVSRDGSLIWFENILHCSGPQKESREMIGVMFDITERKNAEETIRKANEELEMRVEQRTAELKKANETLQQEIRDRIEAEGALRKSEQWLLNLISNIPGAVYRCTAGEDLKLEFISSPITEICGYQPAEFLSPGSRKLDDLISEEDRNKIKETLRRATVDGKPFSVEYRLVDAAGRTVWVEDRGRVAANGHSAYLDGVLQDVTERKKSEEMLNASLQEKELLLKEIHHRVKNNMQIITSLLNLQKAFTKNKETWDILNECQNRVLSMALVHEKLYQTKDLARIDIGAYLRDLTAYLFRSYGVSSINRKVDSNDVFLNIDTAIPCGLIVHELVSNAIKYAFTDGREGTIAVQLQSEKDRFVLSVEDDGIGFPREIDYREVSSLGLKLVNTLAAQLDGEVEMKSGQGTRFSIVFSPMRPV